MKLLARRALFLLAWSPLMLLATDCANQAEGERCDLNNQNKDCNAGLLCAQVFVSGTYHYICCPQPPAPVSVAACNASGGPPADAGAPRADGSTPDARQEGGAESSAPDSPRSDAVGETSDDRATIDTTDGSIDDISADIPTSDASGEGADVANDAPVDLMPATDATGDATSDDAPSRDAPSGDSDDATSDGPLLDVLAPIDAADGADAPTADGPG